MSRARGMSGIVALVGGLLLLGCTDYASPSIEAIVVNETAVPILLVVSGTEVRTYMVPADGVQRATEEVYLNWSGRISDIGNASGQILAYGPSCEVLGSASVRAGRYKVRIRSDRTLSIEETPDYGATLAQLQSPSGLNACP